MELAPANITFLGLGSMANAILQGLLKATAGQHISISATTNSANSAAKYAGLQGVDVRSLEEHSNANQEFAAQANVVVLAMKPWNITAVLAEIAPVLKSHATVISVAAGIPLAKMREALGSRDDVKLVRAMPNTPALIGQGVTGFALEAEATASENAADLEAAANPAALANWLFSAVGDVLQVPETQIDALSAVSGSGPAYLFWFVEQFTAAAERLGFDPQAAKILAENTVTGAAALLAAGDKTAAEQRIAVTSPNGTTEKALAAFNAADPAAMFDAALAAAIARAQEIAAGN